MRILYKDLLRFLKETPSIDDISEKLFQLGHENETFNGIIELELTPNRGDCLSVSGVARDLGAFYGYQERIDIYEKDISNFILDFENLSPEFCSDISFLRIEVDNVETIYSEYMQSYFDKLDMKKNNFFTDISNFISYELGQPTHCFDANKINGKIIFENKDCDSKFETLTDKEIQITGKNSIFHIDNKIISLAGVMGGKSTECDANTNTALIECAYFKPSSIMGKKVKYNIQSDAAHKFERGTDPLCHMKILRRFIQIVDEHSHIKNVEIYSNKSINFEEKLIEIDINKVNSILGTNISEESFSQNLSSLGFIFDDKIIKVPSYRSDIATQNDLAEEIARLIGYNNIPSQTITLPQNKIHSKSKAINAIKQLLIQNGFNEVINFPFSNESRSEAVICIDNPLDKNKPFLRTNLKNSLLENLLFNERRQKTL